MTVVAIVREFADGSWVVQGDSSKSDEEVSADLDAVSNGRVLLRSYALFSEPDKNLTNKLKLL